MKHSRYILFALGVVIFVALGFIKTDKKPENSGTEESTEVASCYIWNTEAGDSAQLKIILEGINPDGSAKVSGFLHTSFYEKDKKEGVFSGNLSSTDGKTSLVTALWDTTAEGVSAKEQLYITFDGSVAKPGFGEMKLKDGVFVYANPSAISYDIPLQKTDCTDSAFK